jgi:hypothetical protein
VDDPYDLTESAWRRRLARRLAEERGLERARARAEALRAAAELVTPVEPAKRTPSPAQLRQLAAARARRWAGADGATRRVLMGRLVALRWRKTTAEHRHHVGIVLSRARWHPPPDPKAPPGGGRYR